MMKSTYITAGGVSVERMTRPVPVEGAIDRLIDALDYRRGVLLTSTYEYPGRYTRWDIGFQDPPLQIVASGRHVAVRALNARGTILLSAISNALQKSEDGEFSATAENSLTFTVAQPARRVPEEERSRQPSVFTVLRTVIQLFASDQDPYLGLYGAFGYDLAFQFEPLQLHLERGPAHRDLVLYLPDAIVVVDHQRERAEVRSYDFCFEGESTFGRSRETPTSRPVAPRSPERSCDHSPGEYAHLVEDAKERFRRGDLFEVVPGQTFFEPAEGNPSEMFRRLRERNPAPYGFLMNLAEGEYLVGASPEMYVRVEGDRVETCPISGTIARGQDPIADAARVLALLNSRKDEAELTMCTDVDRNDKSRICVPGSVRVIGRRQIEMYSRVIHTVDHVEGRLRSGYDALDAFLTHAWAVTVTGAPKTWAMRFLEEHERSPRGWYGGAVGMLGFDGNMNTGLTLRTIRVRDGIAEVRAGATLLFDSVPDEEEQETRMKAAALLDAIRVPDAKNVDSRPVGLPGLGRQILLVDHDDSFVHTLANYLRQTGADVVTLRYDVAREELRRLRPDLVVLSPGPGTPADFDTASTLREAVDLGIPVFGVCLGLQAIAEFFGGKLGMLEVPVHGKPTRLSFAAEGLFTGLRGPLTVGRYHSLYALPDAIPQEIRVTAYSDDGVIMALEHRRLPIAAVQFHPESIMSLEDDGGLRLVYNAVAVLAQSGAEAAR